MKESEQIELDIEEVVEAPILSDYANFVDAMWVPSNPDIGMKKELVISILRASLGLSEEVGELNGKLKKFFRGDSGREFPKEAVVKEMGDVFFYLFCLMNLLEIDPYDVLHANVEKLTDRKERGVLRGSGDDR